MSVEHETLIRENARLLAENKSYREKNRRLRDQVAQAQKEHDERIAELEQQYTQQVEELSAAQEELMAAVESVETERDEWRGKYEGAPDEFGQELKTVREQLLQRDHRDFFREHIYGKALDEAGEVQVNPDFPVESLWREMGYTPGTDLPDPAALKQQLLQAREAKKYLFAAAKTPAVPGPTGAESAPKKTPPLPPGPGAQRGTPDPRANGAMVVTRAQMRDPKFTIRNQKDLTDAAAKGLLVVEEG